MTRGLSRWIWGGIAAAVLLLPMLAVPEWSGAPDEGPIWWPHVASWTIGLLVVAIAGVVAGRVAVWIPRLPFAWPVVGTWPVMVLLAMLVLALSAFVMRSVFASNPHLVDEVAQLFHARVLISGRLAAPAPQPAEAFLIMHTAVTDAGWVSQYPPGHIVLLAVGLLLHLEWLVNPVLGGLSVVLVYLVSRGLYGSKTATIAAFLWAVSSWVWFMSGTYMNHVSATTFALVGWALLWASERPRAVHFAAAGLALAAVTATRPLDGVAAGFVVVAWMFVRKRWSAVPWLVLGAAPVAIGWGYLNWRIYGNPLTLGYLVVWGPAEGLGFHTDPWGQSFTPLTALSNLTVAIRRLHIYLYEWPIPALLPLAVWGALTRHRNPSDLVVGIGVLSVPFLYFFYWHSGFHPGARFYYAAAPMLVIASARGWWWAWRRARRSSSRLLRWDVALATASALVLIWGWAGILPKRFDFYRTGLASMKLHPERSLRDLGVDQALVIIPTSWGARTATRFWSLDVPVGLVERAFRQLDACDLHLFERRARRAGWSGEAVADSLKRMLAESAEPVPRVPNWHDPSLRLRTGGKIPEPCRVELERDLRGFTVYGTLAWRNAVGLGSGIVFARDLYERNEALFAGYSGWEVWRYAPPEGQPLRPPVLSRVRQGADASSPMGFAKP